MDERRGEGEVIERLERIERLVKIVVGGVGRQWDVLQTLSRHLFDLRDEVRGRPHDPPHGPS